MREHEFFPPNTYGFAYCKHCGVRNHDGMHETCLERPDVEVPDRPRRVPAVDDINTIHSRLAELRQVQKDALNAKDDG